MPLSNPAAALRRLSLVTPLAIGLALGASTADAKRLALVVGVSDYESLADLRNPVRDASEVAKQLTDLGFDVTLLTDTGDAAFDAMLDAFVIRAEAETAETTLFYFSGHAFQSDGTNYLVPRDATLSDAGALADETWRLDDIVARLQGRDRSTLIFLDACRERPEAAGLRADTPQGLAKLESGTGTFVAFATQPNNLASDGAGENSPFTTALLQHLETPGISISDMMIRVRNDVEQATLSLQTPWDQSSLRRQFYFEPLSGGGSTLTAADYEMLASMPAEMRDRMLALMQTGGIEVDGGQVKDVVVAQQVAALNIDIVDEETAPSQDEDGGFQIVGLTQGQLQGLIEAETADDDEGGFQITSVDVATLLGIEPATIAARNAVERPEESAVLLASLDLSSFGPARSVDVARGMARVDAIAPDADDLTAAGLDTDTPADTLSGRALATAVQSELARLGCYRMGIDGDFGRGSRLALVRYYGTKQVVADTLDPTNALLGVLRAEPEVVCEVSEVRDQRVARVTQSVATVRKEQEATQEVRQRGRLSGQNPESGKETRPIGIFGVR